MMNQDLSQQEIDKVVIAQADDDSAWGKPIRVSSRVGIERTKPRIKKNRRPLAIVAERRRKKTISHKQMK